MSLEIDTPHTHICGYSHKYPRRLYLKTKGCGGVFTHKKIEEDIHICPFCNRETSRNLPPDCMIDRALKFNNQKQIKCLK